MKKEIKLFTINYSRERWRKLSWKRVATINRLSFLKCRLAAGCQTVKTEIGELETCLTQLFARQLEGSKIRSRVRWLEEGESPSRFFLPLENERYAKTFVSSEFNASGNEVFSLPEIMEAHTAFYSDLFSRGNIDLDA